MLVPVAGEMKLTSLLIVALRSLARSLSRGPIVVSFDLVQLQPTGFIVNPQVKITLFIFSFSLHLFSHYYINS